eukprot:scaffold183922_cov18-Tisochrysis_lutea.AAC.1
MLGICSFQSGRGVGIRAEFKFYKTNVSVLRRDLCRIRVGKLAWNKAHKDSIRASLVPGRGSSNVRENPFRDNLGDAFRDFYTLLQASPILAGIYTNKG